MRRTHRLLLMLLPLLLLLPLRRTPPLALAHKGPVPRPR